jgi:outer membrane protein
MKYLKSIFILLFLTLLQQGYTQTQELSVSGAIQQALENNYGIIISKGNLEVASLNNNWGTAGRYPSVGFEASINKNLDLGTGIGLNWVLFDGFRVKVTKSILESSEDLSSGRLGIMVESTIEEVILAYYRVLLESERLDVLKTVLELSKDRYDYELKRKALGSSVSYTVLQAENNYLSDKATFLDQEMNVRSAKRNLNFQMAQDPLESYDFTEAFLADSTHFVLSDLMSKMLGSNQSLKNQYINLVMKEKDIQLKKASFYPRVSTSAGVTSNLSSADYYANLGLSYSLYNGGVRKRSLEVAKIQHENEGVATEQMEHALTNELYNLYDYHEVRISLLGVADKSLQAAALNLKMSEERYRSGVINSFNYRDVQLMYLDASLRRLQAIYNLIDSKTGLTRIIGGYVGGKGQ